MTEATAIKPMYEHILIKRAPKKDKTKGGIIIPHTARVNPIRGEVVAVGCGRQNKNGKLDDMWVKAGDKIIYSEHAEKTMQFNEQDFMLIEDQDVFGVVKGSDNEEIEPLNDRLIVKRKKREEFTSGGIILTGQKNESDRGYVLAKGPKVSVFVDDLILFRSGDGLEFEINGETFLMLREQDILGVLE